MCTNIHVGLSGIRDSSIRVKVITHLIIHMMTVTFEWFIRYQNLTEAEGSNQQVVLENQKSLDKSQFTITKINTTVPRFSAVESITSLVKSCENRVV